MRILSIMYLDVLVWGSWKPGSAGPGDGGLGGSHTGGGSSARSWRCERVHIHLCWNKKCVSLGDIYLMKLYPGLPPHFMCSNK